MPGRVLRALWKCSETAFIFRYVRSTHVLIELNMTGGMQTEFCISNACIDGTKPHQKHCVCVCVCVMTADTKLIQINIGFL